VHVFARLVAAGYGLLAAGGCVCVLFDGQERLRMAQGACPLTLALHSTWGLSLCSGTLVHGCLWACTNPPATPPMHTLAQPTEGILLLDLRAASWQVLYANDSFRAATGLPHLLAPGRQEDGKPVDFWQLFAHASAGSGGSYNVCAGEGGGGLRACGR
jgi:hypothetical protein